MKICPQCGTEYLPHVEMCVDCHVLLVSESEFNAKLTSLHDSEDLILIRTEEPTWIKAFADELSRAGIPSLIKVEHAPVQTAARGNFGQGWLYGIYVRPTDASQARALDEQRWANLIEEEDSVTASDDLSEQRCPACGAWVGLGATECPSCGLFLAAE